MKHGATQAPGIVRAVLWGLAAAFIWTLLSAFLTAKLIRSEVVDMESVGYFSMGILLMAGFLAGRITGTASGGITPKEMLYAAVSVLGLLLVCNFLFVGGDLGGMGVCTVLIFLGCFGNLIPGMKKKSGKGRKRYKIPRSKLCTFTTG